MTRKQQLQFENLFSAEIILRRAHLHLCQRERSDIDALTILADLLLDALYEREQLKAQVAAA